MDTKKYKSVPEKQRKQFASLLLLDEMINHHVYWPLKGDHYFKAIEPTLLMMKEQGLIGIDPDNRRYKPLDKGRELLIEFDKRYQEFLKIYDIFSLVDTGNGEFAFSKYHDFEFDEDGHSQDWEDYKNDERWEDLRIAIFEYKEIDPIEMIFYAFINEGAFDTTKEDWVFELFADVIWDDIISICNNNLQLEDVDDIIEDVWERGTKAMLEIVKLEDEMLADEEEYEEEEEIIEEIIEEKTYINEVEECYLDYDYCYGYVYGGPVYRPLFWW